MNELKQIIRSYKNLQKIGKPCVLATLVKVKGSHYRRPGAKTLISESGKITGAISGGCLETELKRVAHQVINSGESVLVKYDSSSTDEIVFGLGIGCGGVIEIYVEPIIENTHFYLDNLAEWFDSNCKIVSAIMYNSTDKSMIGKQLILPQDGHIVTNIENENIIQNITEWIEGISPYSDNLNSIIDIDGERCEIFCDFIAPATRILIVGAGNDAVPLVRFAKLLGWEVILADHRSDYVNAERFSDVDELILTPSEIILTNVNITEMDAVVILTHNFLNDVELLKNLLPINLKYLGLLGARKRSLKLLQEVEKAGVMSIRDAQMKLFTPVGLDIGSETPEEIALAIVSEIKATLSGKRGGSLRGIKEAQKKMNFKL